VKFLKTVIARNPWRCGGIGFYSFSLEHFHDLAGVHHVAQEIVDVGKACRLRFVGCLIGAVAQRDSNHIATLGVSRDVTSRFQFRYRSAEIIVGTILKDVRGRHRDRRSHTCQRRKLPGPLE
jgi:hypothetical protein